MIIKLENISKTYKNEIEYPVLKNISFSIEKGEFVAIIGPSGSGKSTLMHILGCLDKPTSGKYFFEGKDVSSLSDDELAEIRKKKIGFVFQQFNLLPHRSVLKNVMLPLVYAGVSSFERERIAKEVLRNSAFPEDFWYHLPNQLSGGMMQRVAIARALVNDPVLILADEPTGNLDSKTGEKVLETFEGLNKQGRTIILVTHERYIAKRAKRIISLKDGKIISDTKESDHQEILKEIKE